VAPMEMRSVFKSARCIRSSIETRRMDSVVILRFQNTIVNLGVAMNPVRSSGFSRLAMAMTTWQWNHLKAELQTTAMFKFSTLGSNMGLKSNTSAGNLRDTLATKGN
jgi:hypothetical protein